MLKSRFFRQPIFSLAKTGCHGTVLTIVLVLTSYFMGCSFPESKSKSASLISLISNAQQFDGKFIKTMGFLVVEFEGTAIYLTEIDAFNKINLNAVRLSLPPSRSDSSWRDEFSNQYVIVEGRFHPPTSSNDMFSGYITDVSRIDSWNRKQQSKALSN